MEKKYIAPKIEMTDFFVEDIITSSGDELPDQEL